MAGPAITVSSLSKRYQIGARVRDRTLREALVDAVLGPVRRLRSFGRSSYREEDAIWALKDVSFEVQPGEVLGVIGRNGAGKSTLLKILSRITDPTEGSAGLSGRVGSLLEVGTGFHPELTGRENIYLSGAILGMRKAEIDAKLDEIVDFSGIEPFIDTPVKRYSSGMRVRLGFAVAAHLEPEILLIDEVLAVGDAGFQRKCLGKMGDIGRGGRTVLFVSHNMPAVRNLCTRCLALEDGRVLALGDVGDTVRTYLDSFGAAAEDAEDGRLAFAVTPPDPLPRAYVTRIELLDEAGNPATVVSTGSPARARIHFRVREAGCRFGVWLEISTGDGVRLIGFNSQRTAGLQIACDPGDHHVDCILPELPLSAGQYVIGAGLHLRVGGPIHMAERVGRFEVAPSDVFGTGLPLVARISLLALDHTWHVPEQPGVRVIEYR